jgi:hypothetical protein
MSALAIMPQSADTLFYSVRSAFIGSNREARHAGARQARTATASSVAITPERTTGSRGFVRKSIDWKMRVAVKLITKPSPSPNSAGRRPSHQHQLQELISLRAERHADSQFRGPLSGKVGKHAVQSHRSKNQRPCNRRRSQHERAGNTSNTQLLYQSDWRRH